MLKFNFITITPLHISNGEQLGFGIDYIIKNNYVYKLNPLKVAQTFADKRLINFNSDYTFKDIIDIITKNSNLLNESHSFYKVKASKDFVDLINNERAVGRKYFSDFINTSGHFYIPASSIKGALLTAIGIEQLGINPDDAKIKDKVVFTDSTFLDSDNFEVLLTNNRPPKVSLLCLKPEKLFSLSMKKTGSLKLEAVKKSLSEYSKNQIDLAKKFVVKYKSKPGQRPKGADIFHEALKVISDYKLEKDEYILNIGFGGGSWFKVFKNTVPKFQSKSPKPGRRGNEEEAHTTVSFNFGGRTDHIGWCKIKIEEM